MRCIECGHSLEACEQYRTPEGHGVCADCLHAGQPLPFTGSYSDLLNIKVDLFKSLRRQLHGQLIGDHELAILRTFRARVHRVNQLLHRADRRSTPRPGINWTTFLPLIG